MVVRLEKLRRTEVNGEIVKSHPQPPRNSVMNRVAFGLFLIVAERAISSVARVCYNYAIKDLSAEQKELRLTKIKTIAWGILLLSGAALASSAIWTLPPAFLMTAGTFAVFSLFAMKVAYIKDMPPQKSPTI